MMDRLRAQALAPGPRSVHDHVTPPIVQQLVKAEAHSVLELGCGDGWFSSALDRCGFSVSGFDRDVNRLDIAKMHYPHLDFHAGDAMLPLPQPLVGRFDAVVSIDLVDHVPHPRRLVACALSALKPGGVLIVTSRFHGYSKNLALALAGRFDDRWDPLLDEGRLKCFSRATLTALLQAFDLRDIHFETAGRIPLFARTMLMSARKADSAAAP